MSEPLQLRCDPETLREIIEDPAAVAARIEELRRQVAEAPDEIGELAARGELIELLRARGDLDGALEQARAAVDRARIAGTPVTSAKAGGAGLTAHQHLSQLRLAHVHQRRGEFDQSDAIFSLLQDSISDFGPVVEAFTHHHAGLNDYDQGRYEDAADHFAAALRIREGLEVPEAEQSRQGLQAAQRRKDSE